MTQGPTNPPAAREGRGREKGPGRELHQMACGLHHPPTTSQGVADAFIAGAAGPLFSISPPEKRSPQRPGIPPE